MENHTVNQSCYSELWDLDLSRILDQDPTECFTFGLPFIILWVFTPLEAYYQRNITNKKVPYSRFFLVKLLLTVMLMTITIIDLGKSVQDNYLNINTVYLCIKILSFSLVIVITFYNKKYFMPTSGLLWTFWMLLSTDATIWFKNLLEKENHNENCLTYKCISRMIYHTAVLLLYILNCLDDPKPQLSECPAIEKPCPEENASLSSRLFLNWFNPIISKGLKNPLEHSDLWSLNKADKTNAIVSKFLKNLDENLDNSDKKQNVPTALKNTSNLYKSKKNKEKQKVCVQDLVDETFGSTFGTMLWVVIIFKTIPIVTIFATPEILISFIDFLSNSDEPMWKGLCYPFLFFGIALIQTFALNYSIKYEFSNGLRMRTALMGAIYRKLLRISNSSLKSFTNEKIVDLMFNDTQQYIYYTGTITIGAISMQIGTALYQLWLILGPSALSSLVVMVILIFIAECNNKEREKLDIEKEEMKNKRVKLMNEILSGIRVIKRHAWEPSFEHQILKIRDEEMRLLKKNNQYSVNHRVIMSSKRFLIYFASIATFVLIDEKNVLDTSTAFVSLSLMNILESSFLQLPTLIRNLFEYQFRSTRIDEFLNSEEVNPDNVQHDQSKVNPLIIEKGYFSWNLEGEPTLRNINLQIKQGQLVAIVGADGSGKSSLISAFLGEMEKLSGIANVKGTIAYVSQEAWIQNNTLQNNILFGKPLDQDLYHRVIDACALASDFKILPAGDQTEIGENGINLSDEQKQRISLARAIYSDADIYFLDDPLSAVNSDVGKHIFKNLIGPLGLMKGKTRILVTRDITYLPEVDNIIVLKNGIINESGTYEELIKKHEVFADLLKQHLQEMTPLIIKNGNFLWDPEGEPILRNINLQIKQGQLVAIVGAVGSGKTSLISAFLGEMKKLSGRVNVKGRVAYVSQQAWLQNDTLQNNILFGKPLDENLYQQVIDACALTPDLEILPAGDQTEIGENGINLSDEQKQRVSLARTIYGDLDIYFFDDPLSAVDSYVGKHIFEKLIGPHGLMKGKTRILVTREITCLPEVDNIIVLEDGEINESGTYEELIKKPGIFADLLAQYLQETKSKDETNKELIENKLRLNDTISNRKSQYTVNLEESIPVNMTEFVSIEKVRSLNKSWHRNNLHNNYTKNENSHKKMETENAETDSDQWIWMVCFDYLKSSGWFLATLTVSMYVIFQNFNIGANMWLNYWTSDNDTVVNGTTNTSRRIMYVSIYGAFGICSAVSIYFGELASKLSFWLTGRQMHINMLHRVMRAPLSFFDVTPINRIISRFNGDMDSLDKILPGLISNWMYDLIEVTAVLAVIAYITPLFIVVLLPIVIIYCTTQHEYIIISRQLERLKSGSSSPIRLHFNETIAGAQTIRAYNIQERRIEEFENKVDLNQVCCYSTSIAERWMLVNSKLVGALLIFFVALFAVLAKGTINVGLAALAINYALHITFLLSCLMNRTLDLETNIAAVKRIKEYSDIPQGTSFP